MGISELQKVWSLILGRRGTNLPSHVSASLGVSCKYRQDLWASEEHLPEIKYMEFG